MSILITVKSSFPDHAHSLHSSIWNLKFHIFLKQSRKESRLLIKYPIVWQLTNKIRDLEHYQVICYVDGKVCSSGGWITRSQSTKMQFMFPRREGCKKTQKPSGPNDLRAQIRLRMWDTALNAR